MKRTLLLRLDGESGLVIAGTCLIAGTYGLVRLAYGLFLPDIRASLSMSSAVAGYISSGASLAYCLGALFGLIAARRSRWLVLGALVTAGVGAAGMALAPDLNAFVPLAIVSSTGAGLASPGLVAVVDRNVSSTRSARAQATVNAGTGPGLVAAGLLALLLLPHWRVGFALGAVFTAVAGVSVLLFDRSRAAEGDHTRAAADGRSGPPRSVWPRGWVSTLVAPASGALLFGAASAVVWTYGRAQMVAEGASDSASTFAWVALGVGGTFTVATTRAMSRLHPSRAWLLSTTTVAVAITALGLEAGRLPAALVACTVFGWGFVAATSALIAWAALVIPHQAAPATSILFITLVLGQAAGSAAAGNVADRHGLSAAFVLSAAVTVVAALSGQWLTVGRRASDAPLSTLTPSDSKTTDDTFPRNAPPP
ncbi:MAG: MFS transporter [Nocardioidaceae bacterium]